MSSEPAAPPAEAPLLPPQQQPPQQSPPPPPKSPQELSPADKALAEEGGEIIPHELKREPIDFAQVKPVIETDPKAAPPVANTSATQHVIDLTMKELGHKRLPGVLDAPPKSAAQLAFEQQLARLINLEVNILNICYGAVHNFVAANLQMQPQDSAELGQSMFGGGVRTPIEQAEPQMAVEVYREVRITMREEQQMQVTPGILRRALAAVLSPFRGMLK